MCLLTAGTQSQLCAFPIVLFPRQASLCSASTVVGLLSLPRLSVPYSRCFSLGVFVFWPFLSSLFLFPRLPFLFVFIYPLNYCFPRTYVNGVTFLCVALVLLRSLSGTTHVCNLFVICLSACPYCNFTGLVLVCSSVFPGRVMPSLLASHSFPLLSFFIVEGIYVGQFNCVVSDEKGCRLYLCIFRDPYKDGFIC